MLKDRLKAILIGTPLEPVARSAIRLIRRNQVKKFTTSNEYWEKRYAKFGNSGAGSYGRLAKYKAEILNSFIADNKIMRVIEFGSGDGNQLSLTNYPTYTGVDVSETAVIRCREKFSEDTSKTFLVVKDYDGQKADLALSLDVIYHLVEDEVFTIYMKMLFDAADRFVIIYSSNVNEQPEAQHVRHRKFTDWVEEKRQDFSLKTHIPNRFPFNADDPNNTSFADFYIYEKLV